MFSLKDLRFRGTNPKKHKGTTNNQHVAARESCVAGKYCLVSTYDMHLLTKYQTGASIGVGETIATSLVEYGANLILFSRSEVGYTELLSR